MIPVKIWIQKLKYSSPMSSHSNNSKENGGGIPPITPLSFKYSNHSNKVRKKGGYGGNPPSSKLISTLSSQYWPVFWVQCTNMSQRRSYAELHPKKSKGRQSHQVDEKSIQNHKVSHAIQDCPGCNHPINKVGGCNLIRCSICKIAWCWLCQRVKGDAEDQCHDRKHRSH